MLIIIQIFKWLFSYSLVAAITSPAGPGIIGKPGIRTRVIAFILTIFTVTE